MTDKNGVDVTLGCTAREVGPDSINLGKIGRVVQLSTSPWNGTELAQLASLDWPGSGWSSWCESDELAVIPQESKP